ncbi:hypothetical protein [Agromyces sp. NPDC058104]
MFIVTFSDGHRIPVSATCEQAARNMAYAIEKVFSIVSVRPA